MLAGKQYFKLSHLSDGMMDCWQERLSASLHVAMISCWEASKKERCKDDMQASHRSGLHGSLQDGKPDVMQSGIHAGRPDGWHCIHCE
jgi:hypothetical protein